MPPIHFFHRYVAYTIIFFLLENHKAGTTSFLPKQTCSSASAEWSSLCQFLLQPQTAQVAGAMKSPKNMRENCVVVVVVKSCSYLMRHSSKTLEDHLTRGITSERHFLNQCDILDYETLLKQWISLFYSFRDKKHWSYNCISFQILFP